MSAGYGIFAGSIVGTAKLRFSPERARWVNNEQWHPKQKMTLEDTGMLLLEVPFSDDRKLIMDILRHGDQVEVLEPQALRQKLLATLQNAQAHYQTTPVDSAPKVD